MVFGSALKLVEQWKTDVLPVIKLLQPYAGIRLRNFDGQAAAALHKKLCDIALPNFGRQIIGEFRQDAFVYGLIRRDEDTDTYDAGCLVLDVNGPLWSQLRAEVFGVLSEAPSNPVVQTNAYELLHWFCLAIYGHVPQQREVFEKVFLDQAIFDAVWNAATASELGPRAVYQIRDIPGCMEKIGINCSLPSWWAATVSTFTTSTPPNQSKASNKLPEESSA